MTKSKKIENPAYSESQESKPLMRELYQLGEEIQKKFLTSKSASLLPQPDLFFNSFDITKSFFETSTRYIQKPEVFIQETQKLMQDAFKLWDEALEAIEGRKEELDPIVSPDRSDKRFKDPLWEKNPTFDFIKQSYLLYSQWVDRLVESTPDIEKNTRRKMKFYSRQFVDALSPTNFPLANPTVLMKALDTKGENLMKGYQRLIEDMQQGNAFLNIENTDRKAFKLGLDIAITPGKVIFQNKLMQLIQYEPKTKKVYASPVLIVPAWINKYYILDLRSGNSLVEWLVEQGHTVFIVAWVNPGHEHKDITYEDYLTQGALTALDIVQKHTGEQQIHLMGYCLGGILLTVLLGYLQEEARKSIKSLTLLASPLDFSEAGELLLFTDPYLYGLLCKRMEETGMLDGAVMGATFNMMRSNDLIWSAFINNYLLANDPPQFDMLYWNADVTNMPAKMFKTYIEEFFQKNNLIKRGEMKILGKPIDISKAEVPMFLLAAHDDHISPWKSMYAAIQYLKGPVQFVLSGSGHVAGVVNPPAKNKYGYWVNMSLPSEPTKWLEAADHKPGSWWLAWQQWIESLNKGPKIDAKLRHPHEVIEAAPGSYVRVTAEEALQS